MADVEAAVARVVIMFVTVARLLRESRHGRRRHQRRPFSDTAISASQRGAGTDIAIESPVVVIVGSRLASILVAREISRYSYRKTKQKVTLAFLFNGIGIPVATTGLVYPVWAMVAMALTVITTFLNSMWGQPPLPPAVVDAGAHAQQHVSPLHAPPPSRAAT